MKLCIYHIIPNVSYWCCVLVLALTCHNTAYAQDNEMEYSVGCIANASSGRFAPYLVSALTHGKIVEANAIQADVYFGKNISDDTKFSWGFGAEIIGGIYSHNSYEKWTPETESWILHDISPANARIQQLYGEIRYRSILLTLGMKEHTSYMLNQQLSSGDLVESGNAIPMPEIRLGFEDFVDIPFTNHWVQIDGSISYGPKIDDKFQRSLYNYYNYHIASGEIYTYKHCHLRTSPDQPLCFTVGMQIASFFGGKSEYYQNGQQTRVLYFDKDFKSYINMIIPVFTKKESFVQGSTFGSWDFLASYLTTDKSELRLYFQGPFEDGSGIARRNGLDGIWGIEYVSSHRNLLSGFVLEYIDFRNQSGPIHWQPADTPGTQVTTVVTGRDDYYNNGFYNSYDNYGLSIGTPFLLAPIYNLDGYPAFACNRANGFHVGISGNISDCLDYRILGSYQRGLGQYVYPYTTPRKSVSVMAEGKYQFNQHMSLSMQLAFDRGTLRGNNFGSMLNFTYSGDFSKK